LQKDLAARADVEDAVLGSGAKNRMQQLKLLCPRLVAQLLEEFLEIRVGHERFVRRVIQFPPSGRVRM
jgi:hypothetical protein